jgi:hypothetical protein
VTYPSIDTTIIISISVKAAMSVVNLQLFPDDINIDDTITSESYRLDGV